jgi:hypothetical protein
MTSSLKVLWNRSFAQDQRRRKRARMAVINADLNRCRRLV